ncbi:hypothetical protein QBC37DRAFT_392169 [Rhypophila decipiens]|uniref:Uncharacterized protein n=1 Tax=Rhypophila decipiens TaxID=261697 RepID=A0AAN6XX96_9PEZI|nr:hypothetical protein QBC37DRAFT_392169 [Rhypophila decipiens]
MKFTAVSLLSLLATGVVGESIIVFCKAGKEATQKAKDLVLFDGGKIFYEYNELGGFAATVTNLPTIATDPLFQLKDCTWSFDRIISIPRPVEIVKVE